MDTSYYQLLKNGDIYKFSNKRRKKCTEKDVQKAVQDGGGMMYFPESGSTLIWPGMWSPSDIGKPDCGVPRYEVVEEKPVTRIIHPEEIQASVSRASRERALVRQESTRQESTSKTLKRRPTVIANVNEPQGEIPAFMKFFMEEKKEPEKVQQERVVIGSLRAMTASLIENVPGFGQKLFALRQNFVNAKKQIIEGIWFDYRTKPFQSKDRLNAGENLNDYMILSKLPIEELKNFRKMGILSNRRDTFYQSVLACINDEYLRLDHDSQIAMVQKFQEALVELFETSIEIQGYQGIAFMWAVQTLERQRRGVLYSTFEGLTNQITDQLQYIEFIYGFLTVILGVNIIIVHYTSDKDGTIECQIRNNDPSKPFIILINLGFFKYEPVFWDYKGELYRYLRLDNIGLKTLNKLFQKECSGVARSKTRIMTLEDNVSFRVWTQ